MADGVNVCRILTLRRYSPALRRLEVSEESQDTACGCIRNKSLADSEPANEPAPTFIRRDSEVGQSHAGDAVHGLALVECGREADWHSFDAFVAALRAAHISAEHGAITYESPTIGRFVTGWDVTPTVDGTPIVLNRYPLVDSAWAHADFGSGEMELRYGDEVYELWFNQ